MINDSEMPVVVMGQSVFDMLKMSVGNNAIYSAESVISMGIEFRLDTSIDPNELYGACPISNAMADLIVCSKDLFAAIQDSDSQELKDAASEIVSKKSKH
jgi:hypothetical protein